MTKGTCQRESPFRGVITVSERGQIVVPACLREELDIKRGDKLVVLKRKGNKGFLVLKEEVVFKGWVKPLQSPARRGVSVNGGRQG